MDRGETGTFQRILADAVWRLYVDLSRNAPVLNKKGHPNMIDREHVLYSVERSEDQLSAPVGVILR